MMGLFNDAEVFRPHGANALLLIAPDVELDCTGAGLLGREGVEGLTRFDAHIAKFAGQGPHKFYFHFRAIWRLFISREVTLKIRVAISLASSKAFKTEMRVASFSKPRTS